MFEDILSRILSLITQLESKAYEGSEQACLALQAECAALSRECYEKADAKLMRTSAGQFDTLKMIQRQLSSAADCIYSIKEARFSKKAIKSRGGKPLSETDLVRFVREALASARWRAENPGKTPAYS